MKRDLLISNRRRASSLNTNHTTAELLADFSQLSLGTDVDLPTSDLFDHWDNAEIYAEAANVHRLVNELFPDDGLPNLDILDELANPLPLV